MQWYRKNQYYLFLFLNFSLVLFAGNSEARQHFNQKISLNEKTYLNIFNKNGSINIRTWDEKAIKISATKVSWSWAGKEDLNKVQIIIEHDIANQSIEIKTDYQLNIDKVPVHFNIKIPEFVCLGKIENYNGEIDISNAAGELEVSSSNGKIDIYQFEGNIIASTSNANIYLDTIQGSSIVRLSNGRIKYVDSIGDALLKNSNGKIDVSNLKGNIYIQSDVGHIDIQDVVGIITVQTTYGNVEIDDSTGQTEISTSYGNIDIDELKGFIKATTSYGRLKIVDTQGIIKAETGNGNIIAEIYEVHSGGTEIKTRNGSIVVSIHPALNADIEVFNPIGQLEIDNIMIDFNEDISHHHKKGRLRKGGHKIYLESGIGNITIEKL